jgi:hypothetical protein
VIRFNPFTGNLDFTGTSAGGAVDSVNGQTGAVVLDQDDIGDGTTYKQYSATEKTKLAGIESAADVTDATNVAAAGAFMKSVDDTDDITVGTTNKFATAAEKTKLSNITVTQPVDLDAIETNANNVPGIKTKTDFITVTQAVDLDTIETNANNVPGIKTKTDFITVTQAVDLDTIEADVATIASKQPLDSDLTAIAGLDSATSGTIASDGAGWIKKTYAQLKTALSLTKADVGLSNVDNTSDASKPISSATQTALDNKQPLDADLTTIAGLTPTTDNFMVATASAWASRTPSQARTQMGLGSLATASSVTASQISDATTAGRNMLTAADVAAQTALLDTFTSGAKGLVPASGGGTSNFLRADGTFAAPPGGSGSPGGSTTQIQFNDTGSFAGDADFTWNPTTNDLTLGGTDTGITIKGITTEPSAPAADNLHLYAKKIAGKMIPKMKGPSGLDSPLQVALWQNNWVLWEPSSATAGAWQGTVSTVTSAGTFSVGAPATTNLYTVQPRGRYANVVTTTNQILGIRHSANPTFFLGNTAGQGGFFFFCRMGFDVWTNGGRMFVGLTANAAGATVSADPSSNNNTVGFCIDAADNGLISFLMRGTTATKTSTGFTVVSNRGYDLFMWAAPNSTTVNWRIIDTVAGTEASGSTSTNAPAVNTNMGPNVLAGNAALTTVTAIQMGINRLYIETDY